MPAVPIDRVRERMEARARALGFDARDAALLADHFLDADLAGAAGHGVERLRWLVGLEGLDPRAGVQPVERRDGMAVYRGGGALGYLALARAIDAELADPPDGARVICVLDCFPTGRLGYFAERAARAGLVALVSATSTPRIGHPEGGPPLVGTNPLCLALPDEPEPFVVDVAMGRLTYGAVLTAAAAGAELPAGAAVRPDGSPERDPDAVSDGRAAIVPFGGEQAHKGFALAVLVELLVESLAGGAGHGAVALLAHPRVDAAARLRAIAGDQRLPGERTRATRAAARRRGTLDVPDDLWRWLAGDG
jgi:LDH2 family malate/lactate/ureidoglycolate dehydrogenase